MEYVTRQVSLDQKEELKNAKAQPPLVAELVAAEIITYVESYKEATSEPLVKKMIQGEREMDLGILLSNHDKRFLAKIQIVGNRVPVVGDKNFHFKNNLHPNIYKDNSRRTKWKAP